ncbi:iron-containing redox enzyme family protein [Actinoallomurus rhizosphaericola]|uniref:iron-containing redox enzyme family protein n=1 Tax=Actinoallomurus rhizosphaericola TaxID=2952536 RepID=UPI0020906D47|nr:iron-containing redox enzyme family protein [Actinoallomurus rhizosphaericola]MCO5994036.1 iron-containing redox enzyme family protein [Actinoallomurus rhizosphaericola]
MIANPTLPEARGPLSEAVITALARGSPPEEAPREVRDAEPLGEDLQLALYVCYELHYRGFDGVDPCREWDPELLRLRGRLEDRFLPALRAESPGGTDTAAALGELLVEDPGAYGVSHHLLDTGQWWEMREYLAHRSIYHLKEADPHAWVIPRLQGESKAALVAVEFDEFGGGRGERMHAKLFADLLDGAGLDSRYGHYLDHVPAQTLATVNLMSLFGLHRALRGALVGHFAAAEITTPPGADRLARALTRLGAGAECTRFFTEHIEADAVHEQVMRRDVIGDLLAREPELAADVVLGIQATTFLEDRLAAHLLGSWRAGRTSLRRPLP